MAVFIANSILVTFPDRLSLLDVIIRIRRLSIKSRRASWRFVHCTHTFPWLLCFETITICYSMKVIRYVWHTNKLISSNTEYCISIATFIETIFISLCDINVTRQTSSFWFLLFGKNLTGTRTSVDELRLRACFLSRTLPIFRNVTSRCFDVLFCTLRPCQDMQCQMLRQQKQRTSMGSNDRELTHFPLVNTPCYTHTAFTQVAWAAA